MSKRVILETSLAKAEADRRRAKDEWNKAYANWSTAYGKRQNPDAALFALARTVAELYEAELARANANLDKATAELVRLKAALDALNRAQNRN
jgi:hypothetical protein